MAQASTLPTQRRGEWIEMTWEEFLAWPIQGKTEWVDGEVTVYLPSTIPHVRMVRFVRTLVDHFVRVFDLGEVFSHNTLLPCPVSGSTPPGSTRSRCRMSND